MQLLNLSIGGTVTTSPSCAIPPGLTAPFTTASTATLNWTTIAGALSYNIRYRPSGATSWSTATATGSTVIVSGLAPGTVYECQVETVCVAGTSGYSSSSFFTTAATGTGSASSGRIAVYFNHPVNNAVSTGVNAVYLDHCMADTLIAYFDRARYTIDIAQYNYNQSSGYSSIANAINNALTRGVRVRWIYDGSQSNTGLALLNPGVHTLASPTTSSYGIMHNKVVIIDANSPDPNDAIVSTGSTVWGVNQFNNDYNNTIFIQDSALAHAYQNQFNMMWGDTGSIPNTTLSKFGPFKTDLGAHIFNIGGKTVELYFSPSDHTDSHIQSSINSANTDLYVGMFTFTMSSDANAIVTRHTSGIYAPTIVDQNSTLAGAAYPILTTGLGSLLKTYTGPDIYHNKMMIVDPSNTCSDPQVLTGSHNWTNAAETKNDENTLIIHSDTIANIYYQSFHANYSDLGGTLTAIAPCAATTCGTPSGLFITSIATTTAILNWAMLTGATSYNIQYRATGSSTWSTTTSASNSATLTGLIPATAYEFQVEAVCPSGTGTFSSPGTFTTLALPCSIPAGLSVSGIDTDIATLNWVAVSGAVSYNIQYRIVGTASWTSISSATNSITITPLTPATTYEFQVQVVCASGTSLYSASSVFTTTSTVPPTTCAPPAASTIPTGVTAVSAMLNWTAVTGVTGYNTRYRKIGTTAWTNRTSTVNWLSLTGLTPATAYEFQVQAVCGPAGNSAFNSSKLFITTNAASVSLPDPTQAGNNVTIQPNPASGDFVIHYTLLSPENVTIVVYDIVGKEVLQVVRGIRQNSGDHIHNVSIQAPGLYFIKTMIGNSVTINKVTRL